MRDRECVAFLKWALPRLGLRWAGYRKVRGTVCKRLQRRLATLGLSALDAYRGYLDEHADEWGALEALFCIPISRFYRDRQVFDALGELVLPDIATRARREGRSTLAAWSAGCASGEEPYSLMLVWHHMVAPHYPDLRLSVLATDAEPMMLRRMQTACYAASSLRDLPNSWRAAAFEKKGGLWCLRPVYREGVRALLSDLRGKAPGGPFDLVLCRNVAFTYFDMATQRTVCDVLHRALGSDGWLVIGTKEQLPERTTFTVHDARLGLFRRDGDR